MKQSKMHKMYKISKCIKSQSRKDQINTNKYIQIFLKAQNVKKFSSIFPVFLDKKFCSFLHTRFYQIFTCFMPSMLSLYILNLNFASYLDCLTSK